MAERPLPAMLPALLSLCCLSGCVQPADPSAAADLAAEPTHLTEPRTATADLPPVAVSRIATGTSRAAEALLFRSGAWTTTRETAYTALLVAHPRGNLLIDTGLGTGAAQQFSANGFIWRIALAYEQTASVKERLAAAPATAVHTVDKILLTHLHWDHASGLPDFPDAEVYTTREEYEYALAADRPQVVREQFDDPARRWRFIQFDDGPYENFHASFDLYRDGSVVVVPLPGHTPGSVGVFVNLRSGARYLFPGDVTWVLDALERTAEKPWITRWLVDSDDAATRGSIHKVHRLMQARPSLIVVPAHDPAAWGSVPGYPEFEH